MDIPCFEKHFGLVDIDASVRLYERGQAVYRSGDAIDGVYCIRSGSVAVFTKGHDGHDLQLYVAGSGELLGIPEIMGFETFHCTAISVAPSSICFVARAQFNDFVHLRPEVSVTLMRQICRRIDQVETAL